MDKIEWLKQQWGEEYAPIADKKYPGYFLFAYDIDAEYTLINTDYQDNENTIWIFEEIYNFIRQYEQETTSTIYRFDGYYMNGEFIGNVVELTQEIKTSAHSKD